jgi:hypothetical protein
VCQIQSLFSYFQNYWHSKGTCSRMHRSPLTRARADPPPSACIDIHTTVGSHQRYHCNKCKKNPYEKYDSRHR